MNTTMNTTIATDSPIAIGLIEHELERARKAFNTLSKQPNNYENYNYQLQLVDKAHEKVIDLQKALDLLNFR